MGTMRTVSGALVVGFAASLAAVCAQPDERAVEVETGLDDDVPVPRNAAEQAGDLTAVRDFYDENGDGRGRGDLLHFALAAGPPRLGARQAPDRRPLISRRSRRA